MDNPLRGIALLVGATLFFSVSDAISKILGQHLAAVEIALIRYIVFVAMTAAACWHDRAAPLPVASMKLQVLRGLGLVFSGLCFIEALRHLPLADAASIGFISPMLITALSVPMLGEVVGKRRWTAVAVGFLGVLVVMRPGTGAFRVEALWVIASSTSWAVASVLTRRMAGQTRASVTLFWSSVTGLALLAVLAPTVWVTPSPRDLALCVALGVIASIGQFLMIQAYRFGEAGTLAPFTYVQLAWSTSLGYAIWGTIPDGWTWAGTAIIVASGVYTVHRERVRARERATRAA